MPVRLAVASVVASLVLCTTAYASSVQYNGPVGAGNGAGVEFGAKQAHSRPTLVRRFEFHNVPAACKGYAPTAVSGMLTITMKVGTDRTFRGVQSLNGGDLKVTVSGAFARTFGKASGTIRVRGEVPGCLAADTGRLRWKAPRV